MKNPVVNTQTIATACVRESIENRTTRPHVLPLYATSSFDMEDLDQSIRIFSGSEHGHVYSRYGNPTVDAVAAKIAALEAHGVPDLQPTALMLSSGMSAILTLVLGILRPGQKILAQRNLYGGTTEQFLKIFQPYGIEPLFEDLGQTDRVAHILAQDRTIALLYAETPANPTLECVDLRALSDLAKDHQIPFAVDNTFATPYLQQPLRLGADFIIHSTTKYLNGHGNSLAGALVAKDPEIMRERLWPVMKLAGTNGNPWDAWLTNNGMKTLAIRMRQHSENAQLVAEFLEQHPSVMSVHYPGLQSHPSHHIAQKQMKAYSGMLSFEYSGDLEQTAVMVNKLQLCTMAPTLGDVDTLVMHPATTSHINVPRELRKQQGVHDNLVRLSVGIESADDIIADLMQALG